MLKPVVKTSTSNAPSSSNEPLFASESTALISVGSLISRICTVSAVYPVTIAYVLVPIVNVSIPPGYTKFALVNSSFATMFAGSLMSIICTPLDIPSVSPQSPIAVTIAYVLAPIVNMSEAYAP